MVVGEVVSKQEKWKWRRMIGGGAEGDGFSM